MEEAVGRFGSRTEAEMARDLLAGGGIPARVRADDAGAMHPELGQVGSHSGITLMVGEQDAEEAREFLAAYAAEVAGHGSTPDPTGGRTDDDAVGASGRSGLRYVVLIAVGAIIGGVLVVFGIDVLAAWR